MSLGPPRGPIKSLFDTPGPWTTNDPGPAPPVPRQSARERALSNVPEPLLDTLVQAGHNRQISESDAGRLRSYVIFLMREGRNPFPVVRAFKETLTYLADTVFTQFMNELLDFYKINGYVAEESEIRSCTFEVKQPEPRVTYPEPWAPPPEPIWPVVRPMPQPQQTAPPDTRPKERRPPTNRIRLTNDKAVLDRETKPPIDYKPTEIPGVSKVNGKLTATKYTVKWMRGVCYGYSAAGDSDKIEPFVEKMRDIFGEATIERTLNDKVKGQLEKAVRHAELNSAKTDLEAPESKRSLEGLKDLMDNFTYSDVPGLIEQEETEENESSKSKAFSLSDESVEWIKATLRDIVKHKLNPDPLIVKIEEMFSEKGMRQIFQNARFVMHLRASMRHLLTEAPTKCLEAMDEFSATEPPEGAKRILAPEDPLPEPQPLFGPRTPNFGGPPLRAPVPLMDFGGPPLPPRMVEFSGPRPVPPPLIDFGGPPVPPHAVDFSGPMPPPPLMHFRGPPSPPRPVPPPVVDFDGPLPLMDFSGPPRPLVPPRRPDPVPQWGGEPEIKRGRGPFRNPPGVEPYQRQRQGPQPLFPDC